MTFTCGHEAPAPENMGRGQARTERLAKYFNRVCCDCAIPRAIAYRNTLTDTKGVKLTELAKNDAVLSAQLATKMQSAIDRIKQSY